ncbi:glycosyltransferase [Bacteroidota bacterium]
MIRAAIIFLHNGPFGGATRRISNLFFSASRDSELYFIVSNTYYNQLNQIFPSLPKKNIQVVGEKTDKLIIAAEKNSRINELTYKIDNPSFPRQIYRFIKNYIYQKKLFNEIDRIKREKNIQVFMGIYSGIIPLYFYLFKKKRDVGIIYCNMDSWFSDIFPKEKKYWYKKFSSFNYALENSDYVDFLSPFILKGVRERGINIKDYTVSITPSSFTDYSKCRIGDKSKFQVAFSGRLEKDKNPEMFLDAAEILIKKYDNIIFHIMGEGRLTDIIRKRVDSMRNKNVIFHGFHNNPPEILAETSIFISIQTTNNYPSQSVLEAMACGNAVIATDVGDTRMFINENNGLLINLEINELTQAIEYLYNRKDKCSEMGKYAEKYVKENHNIDKSAEYYLELFEKAYSKVNG